MDLYLGDQLTLWFLDYMDLVSRPALVFALMTDAHLGIYHAQDAIFGYSLTQLG